MFRRNLQKDTGQALLELALVVPIFSLLLLGAVEYGRLAYAAIEISNVMLVCGSCGPVRVGHKFEGDTKVRVCKKCGQTLASKKK